MKAVKSQEAILEILEAGNYVLDEDGNWMLSDNNYSDIADDFCAEMFNYCGKAPTGIWHWIEEWLEEA